MLVIGQSNRTVDMTWTGGQHMSCACAVAVYFAKLSVVFVYENI